MECGTLIEKIVDVALMFKMRLALPKGIKPLAQLQARLWSTTFYTFVYDSWGDACALACIFC